VGCGRECLRVSLCSWILVVKVKAKAGGQAFAGAGASTAPWAISLPPVPLLPIGAAARLRLTHCPLFLFRCLALADNAPPASLALPAAEEGLASNEGRGLLPRAAAFGDPESSSALPPVTGVRGPAGEAAPSPCGALGAAITPRPCALPPIPCALAADFAPWP
jgi:hypothetical protein